MNFTTLAKERYSCRKISSRPIEAEKLEAIKQAAIAAPTAHNFQPLKVWLIQSPEALEKIKIRNTAKIPTYIPYVFHRW